MKIVKIINFYYRLLHLINFDSHRNFRKKLILQNSSKKDNLYDYGEGMFYQSMPPIKLNELPFSVLSRTSILFSIKLLLKGCLLIKELVNSFDIL